MAISTKSPTSRFDNKACIVTGAAFGMGRATALQVAREGGHVFAVDVDAARLEATAAEAKSEDGMMPVHIANLTDPDLAHATVEVAVENLGRRGVLRNVAGIGGTASGSVVYLSAKHTGEEIVLSNRLTLQQRNPA